MKAKSSAPWMALAAPPASPESSHHGLGKFGLRGRVDGWRVVAHELERALRAMRRTTSLADPACAAPVRSSTSSVKVRTVPLSSTLSGDVGNLAGMGPW